MAEGDPKKWLSEVVLVNPKIVEKSTKTVFDREGCLSFPQIYGEVSLWLLLFHLLYFWKNEASTVLQSVFILAVASWTYEYYNMGYVTYSFDCLHFWMICALVSIDAPIR